MYLVLILLYISVCFGRPGIIPKQNQISVVQETENFNTITVPPNCPSGQQWINDGCRDVWRTQNEDPFLRQSASWETQQFENFNVVTVPPNCPVGQEWINGMCRDVWFRRSENDETFIRQSDKSEIHDFKNYNVVTVPPNCPVGQEWINGMCRDVWFRTQMENTLLFAKLMENLNIPKNEVGVLNNEVQFNLNEKNIISVPNQCPSGMKPDKNGVCREIFII